MFYTYMINAFSSFIILWAKLQSKKDWMGFYIWLPYAIIGIFVESYFELIVNPVLKGFWTVILYCLFGLLTGFSADITFWIFKVKWKINSMISAGIVGIVMNITYFLTILIAISTFYINSSTLDWSSSSTFTGLAYFGIIWMILNVFIVVVGGYGLTIQTSKDLKKINFFSFSPFRTNILHLLSGIIYIVISKVEIP